VINGTAYSVLYSYDNASNVVGITYPDGQVLSYSYDSMDRAATVGPYANLTYTLDDQISSISYANGVLTNYTYDSRDRPTRILVMYNGTAKMDLNYTYDGTGNVLSIDSENYTYDYLNRIASSAGPWGTTSYSYDGAGNMVNCTLNGVTSHYSIGPSNTLVQAGSTLMAYDLNGNTVQKSSGTTTWGYSYDFEDRLVNASLNGQPVQSNLYDGSGDRVMATVNGSSMVYAYEGNNVFYERNMTTGAVTDHFYLGRLQLAKLSSSSSYYYHFDALGSIRLVTDFGGVNAFSSNYLPYGIAYGTTGMETFMYTDKPIDASTGLYYFGARFYDASLFRFVSRDSNLGSADDPLTLNRYDYARDNPLVYVDSNGRACFKAMLLWDGHFFDPTSRASIVQMRKLYGDDIGTYFVNIYIPSHKVEIATGIVSAVLAFLGPAVVVLCGESGIFAGSLALVIASLGGDLDNLGRDIRDKDPVALATDLGNIAYDTAMAYLKTLNPVELIELAVTETGWFLGTAGMGDLVDMGVGLAAIGIFAAGLIADVAYNYYYVYLEGY